MSRSANFCHKLIMRVFPVVLLCALIASCSSGSFRQASSPVENQLLAEIALQRGQYLVAVQKYLEMADRSEDVEFARRATQLAYEYGFLVQALPAAERWVELQPDDQAAHAYLGRLYVRRNRPEEAFESLDLSLGESLGRDARDYYLLSSELADIAEPYRALAVFQLFNQNYPDNVAIVSSVASLANMTGEHDLAVNSAREAVLLAPDSAITRVWLARYLLAAGERSSAFEQMAFAVEMLPGLDLELEYVSLLAEAGEQEDAIARLERMSERYPDEPLLIRQRGILALEWKDYSTATQDFSYLLSEAWYVSESFWYLGQIAYEQENYLQAIRYFKRVGDGLWQSKAVNAISRAYLEMGDMNTALAVQRDYLNRYPEQIVPQALVRAELFASVDMLTEAAETMNAALEFDPWNEWLWIYRGNLYDRLGDIEEALDSYRQALEIAPDNPNTLNTLGYSMTVAGKNYAEAYELITKAIEKDPDNPAIMDSKGWVLYRMGDLPQSREWLEKAYQLLADPEIAAHLGEVMWMQGEQEAARKIWSESVEEHPDHPVLTETIEEFLR